VIWKPLPPRLTDTTPEAEAVLRGVMRRRTPAQKWLQLGELFRDARLLHAVGVRSRQPGALVREINRSWLAMHGKPDLAPTSDHAIWEQPMPNIRDLREVLGVLARLDIPHALGGSMASSVYGVDRYTQDADLTVEPFPGKEEAFAAAFGPDWYVSLAAVQDAVRRRSSFNLINTASGFKVDLFVRPDEPFAIEAMKRRVPLTFPDAPEQPVYLYTAEDVILFKLRWYRLGNHTSEQQWRDVLGVVQVQAERLDRPYLEKWAADLGVSDLWQRVWQEAGVG
jgi:hypothetical protein